MNIAGKIGVNRLPAAVVIAVAIGAVVAQAPWSQIQPGLQADELTVDSGAVMPRRITLPGDAIVEKTGIDPVATGSREYSLWGDSAWRPAAR